MKPEKAFENIGLLMTSFAAVLAMKDIENNFRIKEQLVKFSKIPNFDLTANQIKEKELLNKSLTTVRAISHIKKAIPGIDLVFKGAKNMDTGAAFMLLGTYGDFSNKKDNDTSLELMRLVIHAKPEWNTNDSAKMAKKKSKKIALSC